MASYISSYFGSGNPSQPAQGNPSYPPNQTSTSSTWASTVSSRIATLRKALTKGSEEDDPDNEDCSHVSNVLRAYYTEKGRPFPEWLPPDPKKPAVAPVQQYGQYGNAYAQQQQFGSAASHSRTSSSGRGGLSDLWDSGPAQVPSDPQSLRRAPRPHPQALASSNSGGSRQSGSDSYQSQTPSSLRPGLPSQRSNSYQGSSQGSSLPSTSNAPAMGSRDRLRARLQGAGTRSSGPNSPLAYNDSSGNNGQNHSGGNVPQMSASQPWATDAGQYGYDSGYGQPSNNSGSSSYRPRPGPR